MKITRCALPLVLSALAVATPSLARTPIVHSDGDFPLTRWSFSKILAGDGGDAVFGVSGGGNPGAMIQTSITVNANCSAVYGFFFNSEATYNPKTQGAIEKLDYFEDAILFVGHGGGQATGLAIRQGGATYIMTGLITSTQLFWHPLPVLALKSTDFIQVLGGGCPGYVNPDNHPNFVDGPEITFGFFRANSQIPPYPSYSIVAGLDTWTVVIYPMSYVALGDSYSAGEGLWPYFSGTDTPGNKCHRSPQAYGFQLRFPGVRLHPENFLACSGAKVVNLVDPGTAHYDPTTQLARHYPDPHDETRVVSPDTDMVTVSIGGNDLGFEPILQLCAFNDCTSDSFKPYQGDDRPFRVATEQGLARVADIASGAHWLIESQTSGNASIFVLGYPRLFGGSCFGFFFSAQERTWLDGLSEQLDQLLACRAKANGVHYVSVLDTFVGHGVCAGNEAWIEGPISPFNASSRFHPKSRGQRAYAATLQSHMRDWVDRDNPVRPNGLPDNPEPSAPPNCVSPLQLGGADLPTLDELRVSAAGAPPCDAGMFVASQQLHVTGNGFWSGAVVTLRLESDSLDTDFATATADAEGNLDAVVTLPSGAPANADALLLARGLGAAGEPHLLVEGIRLSTSFGSDADGDGIPDPCDTCPGVSDPSTADSDGDGVGDPCDPCAADTENDLDGDGMCGDVDPCPWDSGNDAEADGHCESDDNCPMLANPTQADADGDGVGDACDGAPSDPGVHAAPGAVAGLRFGSDGQTLLWSSAAPAAGGLTVHDVARGAIDALPVSGGVCLFSDGWESEAFDAQDPAPGQGYWYLVRARNALGTGTYGYATDLSERVTGVCP